MNFQDDLDRKTTKFSTQIKRYNTSPAGIGSVSIPASKSAALRLFYALLDVGVNEYPIEPTDFVREYAKTIFAMPVIPMTKDFKNGHIRGQNPAFSGLSTVYRGMFAWPGPIDCCCNP